MRDKIIREIIYTQIVADDNNLCHLAPEPSNRTYTVFFPFKKKTVYVFFLNGKDWIYPFGINHLFSLAQRIILRIVPKKLNSIYNHKTSFPAGHLDR